MKKHLFRWLYRWQQRLALTRQESIALGVVLGLILAGMVGIRVQQRPRAPAPDVQAETLRRFAEIGAAADSLAPSAPEELPPPDEAGALPEAAASEAAASEAPAAAMPLGPVNINTAGRAGLDALPHIGPVLAGRIIAYREAHGAFRRVEDLDRVRGIGPKTMARLQPLVTVGPADVEDEEDAAQEADDRP